MRDRKSGILLHITSLPSSHGIGDLGPQAYEFADFLHSSGQKIWQILPLNPTQVEFGNSPYSSPSAFAGNTVLISPEMLVNEGFISPRDMKGVPKFSKKRVDYPAVLKHKQELLSKSFSRYVQRGDKLSGFGEFCDENEYWLNDYALFESLKKRFSGMKWNQWPEDIRNRKSESLHACQKELATEIEKMKFLQYLFHRQWSDLRQYCNGKNIRIFGDLPLYVSYQSADVWSHPELFKLDGKKNPAVVSGVPPDYFSRTGQLWNNPIYRWDIMKNRGYSWWIRRMERNLRLFDMVRLDHFRGFEGFWEVPSTHRTAEKGRWVAGPGEDFFYSLRDHFPALPFIAEDLGEITPGVLELRDKFGLSGMRVLQFAFGDDPSSEIHQPHNYPENCVAFTGTHDNNTLLGWLFERPGLSGRSRKEIAAERKRVLQYIGRKREGRAGIHWELISTVMESAACIVIFPLQDILGLGNKARMNHPGIPHGNWEWRLLPRQLNGSISAHLLEMTNLYRRG
jgi:4-alpha-glucanotransferase